MNPNLRWKAIFILAVVLICLYGLFGVPSFPTSWAQAATNFTNRMQLGLDLRGGSHLVLQVQVQEAVGNHCDQTIDSLTDELHKQNIPVGEIRRVSDTQILVRNVAPASTGTFQGLVQNQYPDWTVAPAAGEPSGFLLTMKPSVVSDIQQQTMEQSLETIRRRISALGLTEPNVAPTGRGQNQILVELPGEGDPTRAKQVIQAGGQLRLQLVLDNNPYPSEAAALAAHSGVLPPGSQLVPGKGSSANGQAGGQVWYLLNRTPIVTGADLRSADPGPDPNQPGFYQVQFNLSTAAAKRFGPFTAANIGRNMAIVLDNQVQSAPVIQGRIDDQGEITGNFTQQSAKDLALILRAGALPASIKYLEERTIGPSLGHDSIREGVQASIASLIAVLIFLVIYYRLSGINAVVALLMNLLILVAFMAMSGATLTLPGIAGVVLTIGMGVDSNVLIFERIREELRAGKANASAVAIGFDRAFVTIIDTHVTTLVSAAFLFLFGTGPVRGFAVTLIIGLLANLFTSVYVSRVIFDWHLSRMEREAQLSI
ncbi:MAG TPA: protein translocase subunit SecD [Candidatus Limnocylindrales bacterium]|nr:protein translocase subunit SecD [Candidatus Limnocylindrales bacterium]